MLSTKAPAVSQTLYQFTKHNMPKYTNIFINCSLSYLNSQPARSGFSCGRVTWFRYRTFAQVLPPIECLSLTVVQGPRHRFVSRWRHRLSVLCRHHLAVDNATRRWYSNWRIDSMFSGCVTPRTEPEVFGAGRATARELLIWIAKYVRHDMDPLVGVDLNLWPTVYTAVIELSRT